LSGGAECGKLIFRRFLTGRNKLKTDHAATGSDSADRRGADRFPIERDLRYKVLNRRAADEAGAGRTLNMSSNGVLFSAEASLVAGKRIELSISWPAQLNSKVALKLVARGRIVRVEGGLAAVEIQQHEFRTQAAQTAQTAPAVVN
jgi:hypothetical protein